jgi:hypothetical protein
MMVIIVVSTVVDLNFMSQSLLENKQEHLHGQNGRSQHPLMTDEFSNK